MAANTDRPDYSRSHTERGPIGQVFAQRRGIRADLGRYFQPASASHAFISAGWLFSHVEIDLVSLSLILLFMHRQYLNAMSTLTPCSFLLSLMHRTIQLISSA